MCYQWNLWQLKEIARKTRGSTGKHTGWPGISFLNAFNLICSRKIGPYIALIRSALIGPIWPYVALERALYSLIQPFKRPCIAWYSPISPYIALCNPMNGSKNECWTIIVLICWPPWRPIVLRIWIYIYIYICMCTHVYTYIYVNIGVESDCLVEICFFLRLNLVLFTKSAPYKVNCWIRS